MASSEQKPPISVERIQTGVRIEKRLLKVLKALAEYKEMSLGDLLEGSVSAFLQKPFNRQELAQTLARLCADRPSPGPADPPR